jgi:hypothetical protein
MQRLGLACVLALLGSCGDEAGGDADDSTGTAPTSTQPSDPSGSPASDPSADPSADPSTDPTGDPSADDSTTDEPPVDDLPPAGNPNGTCDVPADAGLADTSNPRTVVGDGTPASCTSAATIAAIAAGGVITFDCGPDPVTIVLEQTAKIFNDTGPDIVIDGGNLVTLDGGGQRRILYMNTCDQAQVWTTAQCDNQDHPRLVVQNLTFRNGNSTGEEFPGGGAIWARGGRVRVVHSRFFNNRCDDVGPDTAGAAVLTRNQFDNLPVYVVDSTFGGAAGLGNAGSNGAALGSVTVSWTVINSLFSHNEAIGNGANPADPGTPGGGSGGAIYNDGNDIHLVLCGVDMRNNSANEGGGAVFFVSNTLQGTVTVRDSILSGNPSLGFESQGFPGMYVEAATPPVVENSTIE